MNLTRFIGLVLMLSVLTACGQSPQTASPPIQEENDDDPEDPKPPEPEIEVDEDSQMLINTLVEQDKS